MNCDAAYSSATRSLQVLLLLGADVQKLDQVAGAEYQSLGVQDVQVGALLAVVAERVT